MLGESLVLQLKIIDEEVAEMRRKRAEKIKNEDYPKGDPRRWEPGLNSIKRIGVKWRLRWELSLAFKLEAYFEKVLVAHFGRSKVEELLEIQRRVNQSNIIFFDHIRLSSSLSEGDRNLIEALG